MDFEKNHCTYTAVLDMYDKVTKLLDEGKFTTNVFIDLLTMKFCYKS